MSMNNNELAYRIWVALASDGETKMKGDAQKKIEDILDKVYPENKHQPPPEIKQYPNE